MSFEAWLNNRYAPSTAKAYQRIAGQFSAAHAHAAYADVAAWIGAARERGLQAAAVRLHLFALRTYFRWQVETGLRADNPARSLMLADKPSRDLSLPQLLTPQEIRALRERCASLPLRERGIMGLLAWSALTSREVVNLRVQDVNPSSGRLRVAATGRGNERLILLPKQQSAHLTDYLENERPQLIGGADLSQLVVTRRSNAETPDGVQRVVQGLRPAFGGRRLTPTLIRQSVIAMMLAAGHDLRAVQLFAGHRHPGSTERYRFTGLEELKAAVSSLHPMD